MGDARDLAGTGVPVAAVRAEPGYPQPGGWPGLSGLRRCNLCHVRTLVDLLLPRPCPCGDPRGPACSSCCAGLAQVQARLVLPYPAPVGLPVCAASALYRGPARRLLIAYKERGRRDLGALLAGALVHALLILPAVRAALGPGPARRIVLVPVPASRAAWRARGMDHVALLVRIALPELRRLGRPAGIEVSCAPVLTLTRRVADQAGLPVGDRAGNLRGALRMRRPVDSFRSVRSRDGPPSLVIVIDDVLTTGATVAEAVRALAAGGVRVQSAAVIAAAVRHHPLERLPLSRAGEGD